MEIVENHAPKRFVLENGKLVGLELERLRWFEENGKQKSEVIDTVVLPCDDVILAIGQENAFPWIERDIGIDFDKNGMPIVDKDDDAVDARRRVLRRRRGVGTREHHLGRGARTPGRDLDSQSLPGRLAHRSPRLRDESRQLQSRHARVELQQRLQLAAAHEDAARRADEALSQGSTSRSSSASTPSRRRGKSSAASTATSRRTSPPNLCIECDACIDVCPVNCLTITTDTADDVRPSRASLGARRVNLDAGASTCLPRFRRRSASW